MKKIILIVGLMFLIPHFCWSQGVLTPLPKKTQTKKEASKTTTPKSTNKNKSHQQPAQKSNTQPSKTQLAPPKVSSYKNEVSDNEEVKITPEFIETIKKYDELYPFSEGYAPVRKKNKVGFINTKGELVIPCLYHGAGNFSEGIACVYDQNFNVSFINNEGVEVIKIDPKYKLDKFSYFGNSSKPNGISEYIGYFEKMEFKNGICPLIINLAEGQDYETDTIWIDKKGKIIEKPINLSSTQGDDFYKIYTDENYKEGLKDSFDNIIIPAKYTTLFLPSNGVCLAIITEYKDYESRYEMLMAEERGEEVSRSIYGYVDLNGKSTFTGFDFYKIYEFKNQLSD